MIGVGVDRVPGARTRTVVAQQHAIQQGRDRVEIVAECETKRVNGLQVGLASGLIREEELNGLRVQLDRAAVGWGGSRCRSVKVVALSSSEQGFI